MKLALLFVFLLLTTGVARADLDDTISTSKEDELEADQTAMDIHDVEGEQQTAREQARAQEQIQNTTEKRLKALQKQKAVITQKIKLDISLSEERRKRAERTTAANQKIIKALQAEITTLQASRDKAEKAADDAEAIAKAGRQTIKELKLKKAAAAEKNRQAQLRNKTSQANLNKLKTEADHLNASNN